MLNAYLEDVSEYDFLIVDVHIDPTNSSLQAKYKVMRPAHMDAELYARLTNHLSEFDLLDRYPAQVNIYLAGLEVAFDLAFESGGALGLRAFLLRSADSNSMRFGRNDWRTALLRGLAACDDFCEEGFVGALGYQVGLA